MKPSQWVRILLAVVAFVLPGTSNAVETFVTFDVVTPDPNDVNSPPGNAPLIVVTGGQSIAYSITGIVYTDPNNQSCDPDVTKGLGAAYVTLSTNFADGNCVREANEVSATLNPTGTLALACLGLPFGDDITDIGGSQDLLGDGSTAPNAFANGYKVVIATGRLTAPTADGVYHVWVTPQGSAGGTPAPQEAGAAPVSVLNANLAQPSFGNPPDHITTGPGFYVARGEYHTLTLHITHEGYGDVDVAPNQPGYAPGTEVTLTATPHEGKTFDGWGIYDPNYPGRCRPHYAGHQQPHHARDGRQLGGRRRLRVRRQRRNAPAWHGRRRRRGVAHPPPAPALVRETSTTRKVNKSKRTGPAASSPP
jgi:hypothetical protein